MPPKVAGSTRRTGPKARSGNSSRPRGGRGGARAAAQEAPQELAQAQGKESGDGDSLFVSSDETMPDAPAAAEATDTMDVSMTDIPGEAGITTAEHAETAATADASAGALRPEDPRVSSVRDAETPAASSAPGSPATNATRGKKGIARLPTFKGRRSKEERDAMEAEAAAKKREKLAQLNAETGSGARGRGDRGRGRGRGNDRGGRGGRGGYMGQRNDDSGSFDQGVFSTGVVSENRLGRMIHRGKTFGASSSGGGIKREPRVKTDRDGDGIKNEEPEDGGYISSDPEIDQLGPRKNVDKIDLTSSDEDDEVEITAAGPSRSRRRTGFSTPGLAPVRIQRKEHENAQRKITAEAPGDPEIKTEADTVSPRKAKAKAKDIEVMGSQEHWRGAWGWKEDELGVIHIKDEPTEEPETIPMDIPGQEPAAKDAPSSPELSRKSKVKIKQRRKPRFRDVRAAIVSEEDREEQERHVESLGLIAEELGELVLPPAADGDGDTAMKDSEKSQPIDKKEDRVYLFQLPPVLPSLTVDSGAIKKEPSSLNQERTAPIDLSTPEVVNNTSTTPIKIEDDTADVDTVSPDLPTYLSSGAVGKLRVHKSGRTTLNWGGTSLELGMGTNAHFLQDIIITRIVPEGERVGRDGGEAMAFGQVCGKFVVTPDWDEIVG